MGQELTSLFPDLVGKLRVQTRAGRSRIWAEAPQSCFREVLNHAFTAQGFSHLCTITGLDQGETLVFIYHMARPDGIVLCLKTSVPKSAAVIRTVSDIFPGGVLYERELVDLLGAQVEGLPPGKRYPLPDDWPAGQHPLRKDWKPEGSAGPDSSPNEGEEVENG